MPQLKSSLFLLNSGEYLIEYFKMSKCLFSKVSYFKVKKYANRWRYMTLHELLKVNKEF